MERAKAIANLLEEWFARKGRRFPWRTVRDPYRVMVVEFLLQRTRAEIVEKVYDEFFRKFPSVDALARAETRQIEEIFSKLGLIYRARRLIDIAKVVLEKYHGQVPCNAEMLLELEGVGMYIMSAILNFGCNLPIAVVDKNVMRVANRLWGVHREIEARKSIERLYEYGDARIIAYALIDLGATVCKDKPLCDSCPLDAACPKLPLRKEEWRMLRKVRTPMGVVLKEQNVTKILRWGN
jgi:A/G-specific adenine glycosylase